MRKSLPYIFGIAFYLFAFFGQNSHLTKNKPYLNIALILLGTILLYILVFTKVDENKIAKTGFTMYILNAIKVLILPFLLVGYKYLFGTNDRNKKAPKSIVEKYDIDFKVDLDQCATLKYGKFLRDFDTVERFKQNGKDYELINSKKKYLIRWLDNCTYIQINTNNMSVKNTVKLGNFESNFHYCYIKPSTTHWLEDEIIIKSIRIDTIHD